MAASIQINGGTPGQVTQVPVGVPFTMVDVNANATIQWNFADVPQGPGAGRVSALRVGHADITGSSTASASATPDVSGTYLVTATAGGTTVALSVEVVNSRGYAKPPYAGSLSSAQAKASLNAGATVNREWTRNLDALFDDVEDIGNAAGGGVFPDDIALYIDSAAGDDDNDGSAAHPVATLDALFALLPRTWAKTAVIHDAAAGGGTYVLPSAFAQRIGAAVGSAASALEIQGAATVLIASSHVATSIGAGVLTDSTLALTVDALVGRRLRFTTGSMAGVKFAIAANTATTITVSGGAFGGTPAPGDHYTVEAPATTIQWADNVTFDGAGNKFFMHLVKWESTGSGVMRISRYVSGFAEGCEFDLNGSSSLVVETGAFFDGGGPELNDFLSGSYIHDGVVLVDGSQGIQPSLYGCWVMRDCFVLMLGGFMSLTAVDADRCDFEASTGSTFESSGGGKINHGSVSVIVASRAIISFTDVSNGSGDAISASGGSYVELDGVTGTGNVGYGVSCSRGSRVDFFSSPTITGTKGDIWVNGTVKSYTDEIVVILGGVDDSIPLVKEFDVRLYGALGNGVHDDGPAYQAAFEAAGDYAAGPGYASRYAARCGKVTSGSCRPGEGFLVTTPVSFFSTQNGSSGGGPIQVVWEGSGADGPVIPNTGTSDCITLGDTSQEWGIVRVSNVAFWTNHPGSRAVGAFDCGTALSIGGSVGTGIVEGCQTIGTNCIGNQLKCSGAANYYIRDFKDDGSQSGSFTGSDANEGCIRFNGCGDVVVDDFYSYGEYNFRTNGTGSGSDDATGTAACAIRITPGTDAAWKPTNVTINGFQCGSRNGYSIMVYGGSGRVGKLKLTNFHVQPGINGGVYSELTDNIEIDGGEFKSAGASKLLEAYGLKHFVIRHVTSQGGTAPKILLGDSGCLGGEVIDTPLSSVAGAPCGVAMSAAPAAVVHITQDGLRARVRRAQNTVGANTWGKPGATDLQIDQLGTGDDSRLRMGLILDAGVANDFIRSVERDGEEVPILLDASGGVVPGDLVKASVSIAGTSRKTTTPGDNLLALILTTTSASGVARGLIRSGQY